MNTPFQVAVRIPAAGMLLEGRLTIPAGARWIIIFAQTSGFSHQSRESAFLENMLQKNGYGTLVTDLVGARESSPYGRGMDVKVLTRRLIAITQWIIHYNQPKSYLYGYIGAHTGAAAGINAAVEFDGLIKAMVCRSGRVELAGNSLSDLTTPILLIVGALDKYVLSVNEDALEKIEGPRKLEILEGVSHHFENDAMPRVAALAIDWFASQAKTAAPSAL